MNNITPDQSLSVSNTISPLHLFAQNLKPPLSRKSPARFNCDGRAGVCDVAIVSKLTIDADDTEPLASTIIISTQKLYAGSGPNIPPAVFPFVK